jgi:uncharacterized damage-inducible protein DinB
MFALRYVRRMAEYNRWMNGNLYAAAARLPAAELQRERGAFFGSIIGTLNHIVVGDTVWAQRFATHPSAGASLAPVAALPTPQRLDEIIFSGLPELEQRRKQLDDAILAWAHAIDADALLGDFTWRNLKGVTATKNFGEVVMHFFNHQTHHRGQTTTLLTQAGVDVGVTDLLVLVPNSD